MSNKGEYRIIIYTLLALMVNLCGRAFATKLVLPIWCDSIGTFLISYMTGPVCGAFVGFTNNIIYGIFVEQQSVYCIVGALLGVTIGYFAKKKVFDTQFATMTFGMVLAVISTIFAFIINTVAYGGMCGNVWGNQVMIMCIDSGIPKYFSYFIGQFCVEFLDKLLCAEVVYILIRLTRYFRKHPLKKNKTVAGLVLLIIGLSVCMTEAKLSLAEEETKQDYDSYIQIVYSKEEGLLSGEANVIAQTKDGKLWIGTYAGLFKYDGAKFTLFQDISSIKNVNCLFVDEEGRLWVGTNDDGVTILINEHVVNVIEEENGLLSNSVKGIVCDSVGNYYIGTTEGISKVSLNGGVSVTSLIDDIKNVKKMSADDAGNVVVTTERGEIYWINNGEIISTPAGISRDETYSTAYFSEDNRLMLGTTGNTVYMYDMKDDVPILTDTIILDGIEHINCFYRIDDEIFVCSDNGVAVLYDNLRFTKLNTNNFTSSIENMLIDYQGNLWFSSSRLGLLEMCKSPFKELFPKIGENSVVNSTAKWNDLLFCGTDDGLVIIDEEKSKKLSNRLSELLDGTRVRCLMVDSKDSLWIATAGMGIYRVREYIPGVYDIKNFTEEDGIPGMRFRTIIECSDGRIMVSGDYGVAIIDEDIVINRLDSENGLINEKSLCLLEYKDACYIGSDGGGITKIDSKNNVSYINKDDGLTSNVILRMVYDPCTDGVFIVTSNGLSYLSPEGEIKSLDSFPYSNNFDMICNEDGRCWILSSAGIYIADSKTLINNERKDYVLINSKRGFRNSLVANSWMCRDKDDLYLCCDTGVVKINMSQYDISARSYRMILDQVFVDGESMGINRSDTLVLSSQAEQLVFKPEVLNYSLNDPYVSVYLEGYDSNESICLLSELDKITYSKLKPGSYVFKIAILDGIDGKVVEAASYKIEKEKETEMYQNWWFKLYVCVIAGLVLVWITWFITRIQSQKTLIKQNLELEYAKKQIKMSNETILSIARTVDAKDTNTSEHSFRVSEYSVSIAKRLGYSHDKCENLRQMALLHDIGKIGIPDAILNKPSKLTDEEYEIMKTHVVRGGEILKDFTMIDNVSVGALYHHEKYDGTGYCHGLKGEEIPMDARIIGIADAFDAMTANRVYRKQLDIESVIAELKRCSGTQFDPKLVDIMLSLIDDGEIDVENLYQKSKGELN